MIGTNTKNNRGLTNLKFKSINTALLDDGNNKIEDILVLEYSDLKEVEAKEEIILKARDYYDENGTLVIRGLLDTKLVSKCKIEVESLVNTHFIGRIEDKTDSSSLTLSGFSKI